MAKYRGAHVARAPKGKNKRILILLICAAVFLAAGVTLLLRLPQRVETPDVSLPPVVSQTPVVEPPQMSMPTDKPEPPEPEPEMLPYMAELYAQNPDIVGYVQIEGTRIEGPVMFTQDEDYYLYRNFDKADDLNGTLYVDKHNCVEPRDDNLIIHGHNMKNGAMLHDLLEYRDEDFYQEHKLIRFDELYEAGEYEIVAAFISQVYNKDQDVFKYYQEYDFETQEAFDRFMENIKALSLYDTGVEAEFGDVFITLSTCEYSREDGRMVVVARKLDA